MSKTKTVALLLFLLIGIIADNVLASETSETSPDEMFVAAVQNACSLITRWITKIHSSRTEKRLCLSV